MKKILLFSFLLFLSATFFAQQFSKNDIYNEPFINSDFKKFLKDTGKEHIFKTNSGFIQFPIRNKENYLENFKNNYKHPEDTELYRNMNNAYSENQYYYKETRRIKTLLNISKIALTLCNSLKNSYANDCRSQSNNYNNLVTNYNKANNKISYWYSKAESYQKNYDDYVNEYKYEEEKAYKAKELDRYTITPKKLNEYKEYFLQLKKDFYDYKKNGLKQEIKKTYFDTGEIKTITNYKGINANGKHRVYYKNGNKEVEGYYKNNIVFGKWIFYYENGNVKSVENNAAGLVEGLALLFYEDGKRKVEINYTEGRRDGLFTKYYKNGNISHLENYKNGKSEGEIEHYHENGKVSYKTQFKNDCRYGITEWFFDNGQLETKAEYKYEASNKEGLRWNLLEMFDKNGNSLDKGTLKNGDGTWNRYDEDGDLNIAKMYKNGISIN